MRFHNEKILIKTLGMTSRYSLKYKSLREIDYYALKDHKFYNYDATDIRLSLLLKREYIEEINL